MKLLNRAQFLLMLMSFLAHTARAQQLPSQRPREALLSSQTKQKLLEMQAHRSAPATPMPDQEQRLPSQTVDIKKYETRLPAHTDNTPVSERPKKLPSKSVKIRPPVRHPWASQ